MQSDITGLSLAFSAHKPAEPQKGWSVQIGAFPSQTMAEERLAALAKADATVVEAERIVTAFTSFDGRTLYRARFGLFAANRARDICNSMSKRGQNCFATIQAH